MYTVSLQSLLKGDFSKNYFSEHHVHVSDFSTELQIAEVSATLLKSDSTIDALPRILKILGTIKVNNCGAVSFQYRNSRGKEKVGGWGVG